LKKEERKGTPPRLLFLYILYMYLTFASSHLLYRANRQKYYVAYNFEQYGASGKHKWGGVYDTLNKATLRWDYR
jgi:hypothetical protein